jgi:hypothetical protein
MATGDLVSLAQALSWLNLTVDKSGIVAALVSGVSTQIQNYIGYQIASGTYTRTLNGNSAMMLLLPDRPVTAVSSLTIDTIPVLQATPPGSGFVFDSKFIYLVGDSWSGINYFNRGFQNIVVTYTAGYLTVPPDLQQACLYGLGAAWNLVGSDPTTGSYRAGDTQADSKNVLTVLGKATQLVPPAVLSLISPYRRVAT